MLPRNRDCIILVKDATFPVAISSSLLEAGWTGGTGVQWTGVNTGTRHFEVSLGYGNASGFLLSGSAESGDQFTSMTGTVVNYRVSAMGAGGTVLSTLSFESFTLASRLALGAVPLSYTENTPLFMSVRGRWTTEDELSILGDPLAPAPQLGWVTQVPSALTNYFLGVRTTL